VYLTFTQLKNIIETYKTDWINALSNQKAVYLLTDNETGKLYVGSATSKTELLLSQWVKAMILIKPISISVPADLENEFHGFRLFLF